MNELPKLGVKPNHQGRFEPYVELSNTEWSFGISFANEQIAKAAIREIGEHLLLDASVAEAVGKNNGES